MNDPRLIPFREYMRRSRPWWWWLNPWGYADALEIIQAEAFRAAAGPEAPPPTSDAVRCAWCGAALAQDPDAPHRWRCDRAVQGKCVARGYWYVLCDDLAGVREAALVTDTAGTPSDAVREAAERLRASLVAVPSWEALLPKNCGACEGESDCAGEHEPCGCHETLAVIEASLALLAALRATASPAPGSEEVREAEAVLAEAREALDEIRRRSTDKLAGGIAASFLGAHPRAALRGGQKGGGL